ncbi:MAG: PIN domain nuclease, partial [Candidatus Methanomethylicota archaeon]
LAHILGTIVYTADEKLIKKTHELGYVKHIVQFKI